METVLIVLCVVVAPLWIIFHYITIWKRDKTISPEDESNLGDLLHMAEKLDDRLRNMERILDDEVPDWRSRHHDSL